MSQVQYINEPQPGSIGTSVEEFLLGLGQPGCIVQTGEDPSRVRAMVTLLHGNEPSGTRALFRWLKSGRKPATTMVFLLPSVRAALAEPLFEYRVLPGQRDLNRCFRPPFEDSQGQLAEEILAILARHQPEAVVDLHNTSGSGPGFGVAISIDRKHEALVSLFTSRLVTNDLRLGALMEIAENRYPTVTIECGGRLDAEAHELAWQGLQRFATEADVLSPDPERGVLEVYHNPVRLELVEDCQLVYADSRQSDCDLTLHKDIERFNFGPVAAGTLLGWLGDRGLSIFTSQNLKQESVVSSLVKCRDNGLYAAQDLKLFMITNNPVIAKMDCLFYAVKANGEAVF